jgi:hypothetical protein
MNSCCGFVVFLYISETPPSLCKVIGLFSVCSFYRFTSFASFELRTILTNLVGFQLDITSI